MARIKVFDKTTQTWVYADKSFGKDGISPTVAVSKSGKVTTVSITDKNGTKTATINDGSDGSPGSNGKDGKTPVKGVDFWTAADQESIVQDVIRALGTPVFGRVDAENNIILTGELATGTYTLKYEDTEGNLITIGNYTAEGEPTYTNVLRLAINSDKTPYNSGQGWKTGYRLNSSGTETAAQDIEVTGFIPVTEADTVYFSGVTFPYDGTRKSSCYIAFYDVSFAKLQSFQNSADLSNYECEYDAEHNLTKMSVSRASGYHGLTQANKANIMYMRISAVEINDKSIITVNQPIE